MLLRLLFLTTFASLLIASNVSAKDVDGVANYAYAVFAGTGKYTIDDREI